MNSAYALTFELKEVLSNPVLDDLQTLVHYYCCLSPENTDIHGRYSFQRPGTTYLNLKRHENLCQYNDKC
jgi:hypothetical protein